MSADCFQTLDVSSFRRALAKLHQAVGCGKGRIEVKRRGCDDICVLISKTELESLEHALQIFAETTDFKAMCAIISQLATSTTTIAAIPCDDGALGGATAS